jgi:phosphoribosylanthranilate isomerase
MFRIKICGITSPTDAMAAVDAGTDAIGLNFFEKSRRFIGMAQAKDIVRVLPENVVKVGVFVNASAESIRAMRDELGLDLVQLHGDESDEFSSHLMIPHIRVLRLMGDKNEIPSFANRCRAPNKHLVAIMADSYRAGIYGGSGDVADWAAVKLLKESLGSLPLILAGGLTPDNVADAVSTVCPDAVDVASGVESAPGVKSAERMVQFVLRAQSARVSTPKSPIPSQ